MGKPKFSIGETVNIIRTAKVTDVVSHGGQHPYYSYQLSNKSWHYENELEPFEHEFTPMDDDPGTLGP